MRAASARNRTLRGIGRRCRMNPPSVSTPSVRRLPHVHRSIPMTARAPSDGTTNFVHGFPFVCISIGLIYRKAPVLGVIYNPFLDEMARPITVTSVGSNAARAVHRAKGRRRPPRPARRASSAAAFRSKAVPVALARPPRSALHPRGATAAHIPHSRRMGLRSLAPGRARQSRLVPPPRRRPRRRSVAARLR
jgi:hypothetical protein